MDSLIFSDKLYHGTVLTIGQNTIDSFIQSLLNSRYWEANRDFGKGFYTTIDLNQAKEFAVIQWKRKQGRDRGRNRYIPCVLEIECTHVGSTAQDLTGVFVGPSIQWAQFISKHRLVQCQCEPRHIDVAVGPMADNEFNREAYILMKRGDFEQFYLRITTRNDGTRIGALDLGNQVVFCTETPNTVQLNLVGHYKATLFNHTFAFNGRWEYARIPYR